jgi:hypothetical protein
MRLVALVAGLLFLAACESDAEKLERIRAAIVRDSLDADSLTKVANALGHKVHRFASSTDTAMLRRVIDTATQTRKLAEEARAREDSARVELAWLLRRMQ